jgi:hypothetical protein
VCATCLHWASFLRGARIGVQGGSEKCIENEPMKVGFLGVFDVEAFFESFGGYDIVQYCIIFRAARSLRAGYGPVDNHRLLFS